MLKPPIGDFNHLNYHRSVILITLASTGRLQFSIYCEKARRQKSQGAKRQRGEKAKHQN